VIRLSLIGVRVEVPTNQPIVLLREEEGTRFLPIFIGSPEATAIVYALQGLATPRPLTHDLVANAIEHGRGKVELHGGADPDHLEIEVTDDGELYKALEVFTNKMCPGRWDDVRKPSKNEWKETMVLSFNIAEASAKVRVGPPKDDDEDYALDVWAGVQPLKLVRQAPEPDPVLKAGVALPSYLK